MSLLPDPVDEFNRYDGRKQKQLERLPRCKSCRDHIQQDTAVCIKGDYWCDDCLEEMRERIGDD